jgi:hypothetical protein
MIAPGLPPFSMCQQRCALMLMAALIERYSVQVRSDISAHLNFVAT